MSRRRRFFLTYLATAVIGSAAVFFGAPLVRGSLSNERLGDMVRACRSDTPLSGLASVIIRMPRSRPAQEPDYDRPPGPQPTIPRFRRTDTPDRAGGSRPPASSLSGIPDPPPQANNSVPPTPTYNYSAMWAVVSSDSAAVYDANGYLAQELAPGTLIEVAAVRTNQTDRLAICRYNTQPKGMDVAIIPARFLTIRKGSLDSANADLLSLVMKQVQLEKEIRDLRSSLAAEIAKQNPHSDPYNRATAACLSFNERVKTLKAKADASQGSTRVEAMDELRSMKEEGVQLTRQYESAKRAFDKWNSEHTGVAKEGEPVSARLQQLADLRKQIDRLDAR